jgi:MFS family permease
MDAAATDVARSDGKVISLISTGHFFAHVYTLVLPPLFPLMRDRFGVGFALLGAILTCFNVATLVAQIPVGVLVDRIGARALLIGGLALESVAIALIGAWASFWSTVVLFTLAGVANSVFHPADYAILNASVAKARVGRAFSIHTFSGYVGFAAAPPGILLLTQLIGWQAGLALVGALGLATALVLLWQRDALHESAARSKPAGAKADGALAAGFGLMLSTPILLCWLFFLFLAAGSGGISNFGVSALNLAYDTPLATATLALSGFLFASALGVLLGGVIADRTDRHGTVAALSFFATALLVALVAMVDLAPAMLFLTLTVAGLLNGVVQPSRDMMVRAVTPPGAIGTVFGFVTTGFNLGGAVAPLIFGWLLDYGRPNLVFWLVAGLMLASIVTVGTARRGAPAPAAAD